MSRIGKKLLDLPAQVTVNWDESTRKITVKGPLGELAQEVLPFIQVKIDGNTIELDVENSDDKFQRSMWGTTRAIINNMMEGVSKGFNKEIELSGVGYRMELGQNLVLYIGFSHPVTVTIPTGIKLTLNKNVLSGTSIDKQLIGNFFTSVHNMKPCDVYKHKGFKFPNRFYRKKVGKKGK